MRVLPLWVTRRSINHLASPWYWKELRSAHRRFFGVVFNLSSVFSLKRPLFILAVLCEYLGIDRFLNNEHHA